MPEFDLSKISIRELNSYLQNQAPESESPKFKVRNPFGAHAVAVGLFSDIKVEIEQIENPRIEKENHYYNPKNDKLINLGLKPHHLDTEFIIKNINKILKVRSQINTDVINPRIKWKAN